MAISKYLNFYTYYSAKTSDDYTRKLRQSACFGDMFCRLNKDEEYTCNYTIRVYTSTVKLDLGDNNYCMLTKKEVIKWIEECKKYCNFTYKIEEKKHYFDLKINYTGYGTSHKFLLTYMRYLYEIPFSLYLHEAMYLRKNIPLFKRVNLLELYNLVSATVPCNRHGCDIHNIGASFTFKKKLIPSEIKKKFYKEGFVNNIFTPIDNIDKHLKTIIGNFEELDYWLNEEDIKSRVETYLFNFKLINNKND